MKNLWLTKLVSISLCCSFLIIYNSVVQKKVTARDLHQKSTFGLNSPKEADLRKSLLLLAERTQNHCQSISAEYQEYYNFETRNYSISICSRGEKWFYYRESKSNPENFSLVPAEIVFGGDVFKAVDGKATYFVGRNSEGYYSSVMYGNNQMIFEPELFSSSAIAKQDNITDFTEESNSNLDTTNVVNLDSTTNYWQVCTEDPDDAHPNLNGWQKFIGESPRVISEYASIEGHNFQYANSSIAEAMVETKDGLMVTVNILEPTEMVNGVCVQQMSSF